MCFSYDLCLAWMNVVEMKKKKKEKAEIID